MADTWTYAAGVWTLTLDGTGSGQEARYKDITGLTASTLYTFYSTVNAASVAPEPFIEVDGGDRTTITTTGSHLQFVRGTTNGSGAIRLRRGVADAGLAPAGSGSDGFEYANLGALNAGGWTDSASGVVSLTVGVTDQVHGGSKAIKFTQGSSSTTGTASVTKVFTGLTPGASYTVRVYCYQNSRNWWDTGSKLAVNGVSGVHGTATISGAWEQLYVTETADGSGHLSVVCKRTAGISPVARVIWFDDLSIDGVGGSSTVTWTDWDYCIGTGVPQEPIGEPPDDPPPVDPHLPPPVVGVRPFGVYDILTGGYGYWNSTVKELGTNFGANTINETTANSMYNIFRFGSTDDWTDASGSFRYELWQAKVDEIKNHAIIRPLLDAAIADGWAFCCLVVDEPYHPTRYGPGGIAITTVERMCLYIKSIWPTWPTMIRVAPTFSSWLTRHIIGCNWLWAEYLTKRGDVTAWRDDNIARTSSLGFDGLIMGLHYSQFHGVGTGDITPAEIDHYGTILASSDSPLVVAFHGWKYFNSWYGVAGAAAAVGRLQATFASHDP